MNSNIIKISVMLLAFFFVFPSQANKVLEFLGLSHMVKPISDLRPGYHGDEMELLKDIKFEPVRGDTSFKPDHFYKSGSCTFRVEHNDLKYIKKGKYKILTLSGSPQGQIMNIKMRLMRENRWIRAVFTINCSLPYSSREDLTTDDFAKATNGLIVWKYGWG